MPSLDNDLLQELLNTFRAEAAEHLQAINQSLLKLERAPEEPQRVKILQDAFRAAHSLKGAARAVSQLEIEGLAHTMESVFQQARDAGLALSADICDVLYDGLDAIEKLLSGQRVDAESLQVRLVSLVHNGDAPAVMEHKPVYEPDDDLALPAQGVAGDSIRVSVNKLDDLMAQVGELLVAKISADQRLIESREVNERFDRWAKSWREVKSLTSHLEGEAAQRLDAVLARCADQATGLMESFHSLDQGISRDVVRLGIVTTGLQDRVRNVRMVPFQTLVFTLERTCRDAARSQQKQVHFSVTGSHVELDKKVLEILKDPLLHLVRNAVAHGLEMPEKRVAAGKAAEGHVQVQLQQRGNEVHILVIDDGAGFNLEALRDAYGKRTGVEADENASDEELMGLAFLPGVSTAAELTAISGRGVGLDVVRQSLGSIQGRVSVDSTPGHGTTFHLVVPTSLAMMRGLLVQVGRERYALPLLAIEKIITPDSVFSIAGRQMINVDGKPLPVVSLAHVLQRPVAESEHYQDPIVVVLSVANQRLGLLIDDVLTEQELAVKSLGRPLQRVQNVAGAALLGNGEPLVILNPAELVKAAWQAHAHEVRFIAPDESQSDEKVHILVVDDSITTRTLEKNILEAAGFLVTTATDGTEAIKRLAEFDTIQLVVADVEMPQMNGLMLVETLRASQTYSSLPLILVTSLESREDRERGMMAGADAYIVKRGFDQAELLATIRRLL
jgi:two-component system chemotaxis sensor kinase CheA